MMKGWTRSTSMRMAPLKRRRSYWQTIAIGLSRKQPVHLHLELDQPAAAGHFRNGRADFSDDPDAVPSFAASAVAKIRQPAQQTFRIEPAIGQPDMIGFDKRELPACAGIIHRQAG